MAELIPACDNLNDYIGRLETELTEQYAKNEKMEILSSFSELILDSANVWMEMFDKDGNVLIWNKAAEKISGYSRDEVLYSNRIWRKLYESEEKIREIFLHLQNLGSADAPANLEQEIICKDGTHKWLVWNFIRQRGNDEKSSFICFGNDITERKIAEKEKAELQKQLMIFEKSKALVRVAKGMTHEIANPVSALKNDLGLLEKHASKCGGGNGSCPADKIQSIISRDVRAVKRVADIITAFKSAYRPENWHHLDLNKEIEIQLTFLKKEIIRNITVRKHLTIVSQIQCYGNEIGQIILNLLSNAAESIEGSGTITISTWEDPEKVYVKIEDSGPGIPDVVLPHIFELYYTTKQTGTGLGLAMSAQMAERHGGRLYIEETDIQPQKHGSSFVLELPKKHRGG
jgi:PAS domain S-box-containing protein